MNKKQKSLTNKGFSLVELIIVIAIMAVLVGVLAPQFIKYVEQSRKSTDIQNVASIVTALQTYDIADGKITANQLHRWTVWKNYTYNNIRLLYQWQQITLELLTRH
ncbi:MAG: prepilin-type N-terminal cleavage/methylation domain-containing protein [Lachnospiraceae bacterium]